jgi:predicted Zn-dependent protease
VTEEPLDAEAAQVGKALRQLRIEKSPAAALETLQDYRRRYPAGLLSNEARLAELDADLALGHRAEALQLLESGSPLGEGAQPREAELDLLRAELLVGLGRCGAARPALDRRIAANTGPARVSARALYLRALCAARDGDAHASRSDLEDYLRHFPDQPDHRAVAEALQRMSAP